MTDKSLNRLKNLHIFKKAPIAAAVFAASFGGGQGAYGQETIEEIVVTAQFREENLQDVPLAITAITGEQMRARSQNELTDVVAQAPNVQIKPSSVQGGPSVTSFIRGVGQVDFNFAVEPGVGMYIDDIYYSTLTGANFALVDLDRIEVLRGPQGTLQGRNSIGGSVRLITTKPTGEGGGYVEVGTGRFGRVDGRAAADFSILDDVLVARVAGVFNHKDGFQDRLDFACDQPALAAANGISSQQFGSPDCKLGTNGGTSYAGGRLSMLWTPSDNLDVNFAISRTDENSELAPTELLATTSADGTAGFGVTGAGLGYGDHFLPRSPWITYETYQGAGIGTGPYSAPAVSGIQADDVSLTIDYAISDSLSIKSISAYTEYDSAWNATLDGSPVNMSSVFNDLHHEGFQQEFRLNGVAFDDLVDFTVGAFYYTQDNLAGNRADLAYQFFVPFSGPCSPCEFDFLSSELAESEAKAVFAHSVWHVSDNMDITTGLRYSEETKDQSLTRLNPADSSPVFPAGSFSNFAFRDFTAAGGTQRNTTSDEVVDYRVSLDYRWNDDLMTYISTSTGYKAGGVNPRPFSSLQVVPYQSETVKAYEIGLKADFFDGRVRVNASAFLNQYQDMQQGLQDCSIPSVGDFPGGPCSVTINSGEADIKGLELELTAYLFEGLSANFAASYIEMEFTEFDTALLGTSINLSQVEAPQGVPPYKVNAGVQYEMHIGDLGMITPRLDVAWEDELSAFSTTSRRVDARTLVNARVSWESLSGDWDAALAVTNLTDEHYYNSINDQTSLGTVVTGQLGNPREWTLSLRRKF